MQTQSYSSNVDNLQTGKTDSVVTIQNWLVSQLAEQLSIDPKTIDMNESLTRYGLDSIDAVTLVGELEDWLEVELPSTLFWDYPTIGKSAQYLVSEFDVSAAVGTDTSEAKAAAEKPEETAKTSSNGKGWGGFWKGLSGS